MRLQISSLFAPVDELAAWRDLIPWRRGCRNHLIWILPFVALFFASVPLVVTVVEPHPVSYPASSVVAPSIVVAGGMATISTQRCVRGDDPVPVSLSMGWYRFATKDDPDEFRFLEPPRQAVLDPGCTSSTTLLSVPAVLPAGWYELRGQVRVRGLMRDHVIPWQTTPFQVINPADVSRVR